MSASYLPARRYGGTIVSGHGLCKALAARGHDMHVFTTSVDGPQNSPVPHGVPVDLDGVKVWYFQSHYARRLYWAPAMARELRAQVGGFDLVHTHAMFLWPMWAAARAARRAGVPYVVSPRGMLEKGLVERKSTVLKSVWLRVMDQRNLEHASAIHVTSAREAHEAAAFGFRLPPFVEIPNGADFDDVTGLVSPAVSAILAGGPFMLFLGRVNWKKGLDRLVASLAHAGSVRVVIAGNDEEDYADQLAQQAAALGVRDRICFAGYVAGADKQALIAQSDALILPSYSENFGNVVVEAMAAGRPVIVTPEVGVAEIVQQTGAGLVVAGEPAALGASMARLHADPALRSQLGTRGQDAARRLFGWNHVAEQMEAAYTEAIKCQTVASPPTIPS